LVQPGIKCRGREYLRIIYGPDYTEPRHLERLRDRGLNRKRALPYASTVWGWQRSTPSPSASHYGGSTSWFLPYWHWNPNPPTLDCEQHS
jgi:hypothetical protein